MICSRDPGARLVLARGGPPASGVGAWATPIDLPGDDETAGLPEHTRHLGNTIGGRDAVVLVAKSLGEFTAAGGCNGPMHVLVLVNAMIPRQ